MELEQLKSPFIEVKKGVELKDGDLFYGTEFSQYGLKTILQKVIKPRSVALSKPLEYDLLHGYEGKKMFDDGTILPILYNVITAPSRLIYETYLYPVAIWNITLAALDGVSIRPMWKPLQVLDSAGRPIFLTGPGRQGSNTAVVAYHFVIINDNYVPKPLNDGTGNTDDGNWVIGDPIIGSYVKEQLNAEIRLGSNKLDYPRK